MAERIYPATYSPSSRSKVPPLMAEKIYPVVTEPSTRMDMPTQIAEGTYPTVSELSTTPSVRSTTSTGLSTSKDFEPIKAYTVPGWHSPTYPPPSPIGRPSRRRRSNCNCNYILASVCSTLVIVLIALAIAALVLWLDLQPKLPQYSVDDFHIGYLNLTSRSGGAITDAAQQTVSNTVLNTDIAFNLTIQNPNGKIGIYYNAINVHATYLGKTFAQGHVPAGFYQGHRTTTVLKFDLAATNAPLSDSEGHSLQAAIDKDDIPLHAQIDVKAAIKIGLWKSFYVWIHVVCDMRVSPPTAPQGAKLLFKTCKRKR